MGKQSTLRSIVDRNVERHLVREFLMNNTKGSGFGSLKFERVLNKQNNKPQDILTVTADRPGMVIGSKGKIIKDLQRRLNEEFTLLQPKLMVEEIENATLNAQVMAEFIDSLDMPDNVKAELKKLSPQTYIGQAISFVDQLSK